MALSHSALSPMLYQFVERRTVRVAFARALIVKAAVGPRLPSFDALRRAEFGEASTRDDFTVLTGVKDV